MSKRRTHQQAQRQAKRTQRAISMDNPSGNSAYGRKQNFLRVHGGMGLDYPDKPWR